MMSSTTEEDTDIPSYTVDTTATRTPDVSETCTREKAGRDTSSRVYSKKKNAKNNDDNQLGCTGFTLTYQVIILVILLLALSFSYENTTRSFLKVLLVTFCVEALYFVLLIIGYCQNLDVGGMIVFVFSVCITFLESSFIVYVFYIDSDPICYLNGCTLLTGTFVYRFIYLAFVALFVLIHIIGCIGGLVDSINSKTASTKKKRSSRRSRSNSVSGSRSRSRRSYRRRSRPSKVRVISRESYSRSYAPSSYASEQAQSTTAASSAAASTTATTSAAFVPFSQRDVNQQSAQHLFDTCPVSSGPCYVPTCPYYTPMNQQQRQAQAAHDQQSNASQSLQSNNMQQQPQQLMQYQPQQYVQQQQPQFNNNLPLIIDLPANVANAGGAIDVTRCDTSRVIIRMPGRNQDLPAQQENPRSATYRATVTPMPDSQ